MLSKGSRGQLNYVGLIKNYSDCWQLCERSTYTWTWQNEIRIFVSFNGACSISSWYYRGMNCPFPPHTVIEGKCLFSSRHCYPSLLGAMALAVGRNESYNFFATNIYKHWYRYQWTLLLCGLLFSEIIIYVSSLWSLSHLNHKPLVSRWVKERNHIIFEFLKFFVETIQSQLGPN